MLFDLSNPRRKNVVRVVYGLLAVVFGGGFIFFGIGSETGGGGLFDGIFGDGSGGSTADQYEQQIEDAEETLETDPDNAAALAALAQYRYLSGQAQLETDEQTQAPVLTEEARGEFEEAIDAWNRYLETEPRRPDVATAGNVVQAFVLLGDASGAAEAQRILAQANPSSGTYSTLAYYHYADFNFEAGDRAAEQAVAEAEEGQAGSVERQLSQLRQQAKQQEQQIANLPESPDGGGEGIENPFGGLSPDAGVQP